METRRRKTYFSRSVFAMEWLALRYGWHHQDPAKHLVNLKKTNWINNGIKSGLVEFRFPPPCSNTGRVRGDPGEQ